MSTSQKLRYVNTTHHRKGSLASQETKIKQSKKQKERFKNNPINDETKLKMSLAGCDTFYIDTIINGVSFFIINLKQYCNFYHINYKSASSYLSKNKTYKNHNIHYASKDEIEKYKSRIIFGQYWVEINNP